MPCQECQPTILIVIDCQQWNEAAILHEAAGEIDSAIAVYLKCKNYDKAGQLLQETKASPKMYADYAKAREAIGDFKEAAIAYESAGDWNSVVRCVSFFVHQEKNESLTFYVEHFVNICILDHFIVTTQTIAMQANRVVASAARWSGLLP